MPSSFKAFRMKHGFFFLSLAEEDELQTERETIRASRDPGKDEWRRTGVSEGKLWGLAGTIWSSPRRTNKSGAPQSFDDWEAVWGTCYDWRLHKTKPVNFYDSWLLSWRCLTLQSPVHRYRSIYLSLEEEEEEEEELIRFSWTLLLPLLSQSSCVLCCQM